jgi:TrmH family RNA methyltransferase
MTIKKITSISNPLVRKAIEAKMRRRDPGGNFFLAEGPHLVEMAAAAGSTIGEVFYTLEFGLTDTGKVLLSRLTAATPCPGAFIEVPDNIFSKISDTQAPQGILALVSSMEWTLDKLALGRLPLVSVCDGISDPGNLGTIIRVSDAAGADAVILLPDSCDPYSPKAVRATAGSIFNIPVVSAGCEELIDYLADKNITIYAADVRAERSLYEIDLRLSCALVFGNESRGVSGCMLVRAGKSLKIPIAGKAESLNAAMSAAICLYEAVRQRAEAASR